jgi:hypothetical protein
VDDLLELLDAATLNLIEAVFWIVLGVVLAIRVWGRPAEPRRIGVIASLWLIVFGFSDLIEMRTGAWYRPWWLLALKAACVLALVGCLLWYRAWRTDVIRDGVEKR